MRSKILFFCLAALPALSLATYASPAHAMARNCTDLACAQEQEWSGDHGFGVGYAFWSGVEVHAPNSAPDYLKAGAAMNAYAKMFGVKNRFADMSALAYNNAGQMSAGVCIALMGQHVFCDNVEASWNSFTLGAGDREYFDAQDTIKMHGVKIKVRATVGGGLGVEIEPNLGLSNGNQLYLQVRPFANAYASAEASVGASCASAGIDGSLTFIDLEVPTGVWAIFQRDSIGLMMGSDLHLQGPKGKLEVWGNLCGLKDTTTIAKFGAGKVDETLISKAISIPY